MILPALLIAAFASPALAAERSYSVSDFDQIRVIGPFAVGVTPARATTVKAKGAVQALENVSVEVQDRILTIQPQTASVSSASKASVAPVTIFITVPRLSTIRMLGSGVLTVAELRGAQGDVSATGSGVINVARVATDRLTIRQSGASQVSVAGKTLSLEASSKGTGGIDTSTLVVSDLKLNAASSGTVRMAASRTANVVSSGSGVIDIIGAPACSVQNTGSGEVRCGR